MVATTWKKLYQTATLSLPLGLCLGCTGGQVEHLQAELRVVHEELDDLKRSQATWRVQHEELRNRLLVMEDKADTARVNRDARRDGSAKGPSRDEGTRNDLARAEADRPAPRDDTWIPKLPTVKVEKRPESAAMPPAPSGPADDTPPQEEARPRGDDPATLYEHAKSLYDQEQQASARGLFEQLLKQYPKHDLADNALYWLGESFRRQSLWSKAAQYFLRVVKEYPRANKVPDALLQLGVCYRELGDDQGATEVWRQLQRKFPAEPAARLAAKRLADMATVATPKVEP